MGLPAIEPFGAPPDTHGAAFRVEALSRMMTLLARGPRGRAALRELNQASSLAGVEIAEVALESRRLADLVGGRLATDQEMTLARSLGRSLSPGAAPPWRSTDAVLPVHGRRGVVGLAVLVLDSAGPSAHDEQILDAVAACLSALVQRARLLDTVGQARERLGAVTAQERVWHGAALSTARTLDAAREELGRPGSRSDEPAVSLEAALAMSRYELHAAQREARVLSLARHSLEGALRQQARWFQRETGVAVSLHLPRRPVRVLPITKEAVIRIVGEALWALQPGSRSTFVSIRLRSGEDIELTLRDDGVSLARRMEALASCGPYLGLRVVRQQADAIGAAVRWVARSPRGLEFTVAAPLRSQSRS